MGETDSSGGGAGSAGLGCNVLLLNAHYAALRIINAKRAFSLLIKSTSRDEPLAEVVSIEDGRYVSYTFEDWRELSEFHREFEPAKYDWVRTVRFEIAVPRIVRLLRFSRLPVQQVRLSRRNIYARDQSRCQYCGKKFKSSDLSLDHVIPRVRGGKTTWENIVCACLKCNVRKGGRTPREAGMKLITKPIKPRFSPVLRLALSDDKYRSWKQFIDAAYWNVELK